MLVAHNSKTCENTNLNYVSFCTTWLGGPLVYNCGLEPPIDEIQQSPANPDSPTTHSITTERMMTEKVKPDTFKPPLHKLKQNIEKKM